MNKVKSGAPLL